MVTNNRQPLFGSVISGEIVLNSFGEIVREEWEKTPLLRSEIELDEYAILPDHMHAIFWIIPIPGENDSIVDDLPKGKLQPKSVGSLVGGFKSACTKRINLIKNQPGCPVWQPNYYEHVIRNDADLTRIREYIMLNPERIELLK